MSTVPSFLYSGLDQDTIQLSKQLETLGGGDAKTENIRIHGIFVTPKPSSKTKSRVLWDYGQSIALRDIYQPETSPASESMKYYSVTSTHKLENMIELSNLETGFTRELSIEHELKRINHDLLDGFNHCIMTYGERRAGKTLSLFGDENDANYLDMKYNRGLRINGMIDRLLHHLYRSIALLDGVHVNIAVSAWIIKGQHIIDLLSQVNEGEVAMEFVSVDCPTVDIARKVLYTARNHASGVRTQPDEHHHDDHYIREDDRAHFFARIIIHQTYDHQPTNTSTSSSTYKTMMSVLYIADILGSSLSPDDADMNQLDADDKIHRRDTSLQLSSLSSLFSEMKSSSTSSSYPSSTSSVLDQNNPKLVLTSSRDSKLTSVLGPIITGNCLSSIFVYLVQGEDHYHQSKSSLMTCDHMTDIICPVYRIYDVPLQTLKMRSYESILPTALLYPSLINSPVNISHHNDHHHASSTSSSASSMMKNDHHHHVSSSAASSSLNKSYDDTEYADMDLARLASPDVYLATPKKSSSSSKSVTFPTINHHPNSSSSSGHDMMKSASSSSHNPSRIDNIMGEFHNLMSKIETTTRKDPTISSSSSMKPSSSYVSATHREGMIIPSSASSSHHQPYHNNMMKKQHDNGEEEKKRVDDKDIINHHHHQPDHHDDHHQQREDIISSLQKIRNKSMNQHDIKVIDREISRLISSSSQHHPTHHHHIPSSPSHHSDDYRSNDDDDDDDASVDSLSIASSPASSSSPSYQSPHLFSTLNLPNRLQDTAYSAGISAANYHHHPHLMMPQPSYDDDLHQPSSSSTTSSSPASPHHITSSSSSPMSSHHHQPSSSPSSPRRIIPSSSSSSASSYQHKSVGIIEQMCSSSSSPSSSRPSSPKRQQPSSPPSSSHHHKPNDDHDDDDERRDTVRFRGVHASLLEALNHERAVKHKLQARIDSFEEEMLEMKTQHDVTDSSYQVEVKRLKHQLRNLCDNYSLTDVFASFEENVARLSVENKELRDQNLKLESKLLDIVLSSNDKHKKAKIIYDRQPSASSSSSAAVAYDGVHDDGEEEEMKHATSIEVPELVSAMDSTIKAKLREKIKKLVAEKEGLKVNCEELQKKDRQYILCQKMNDELSRRLRLIFNECEKLKHDIKHEQLMHADKDRDYNILKVELREIQSSERIIRDERARILLEVAQLRDRVREIDAEKKRMNQLNKFVSKHASGPPVIPDNSYVASRSSSPSSSSSTPHHNTMMLRQSYPPPSSSSRLMMDTSSYHHKPSSSSSSTIGLAGVAEAEYYRLEESSSNITLHPELESIIISMHDNIIQHAPKLLPLFKRLQHQIHADRTRSVMEKSRLIGKLANRRPSSSSAAVMNMMIHTPSSTMKKPSSSSTAHKHHKDQQIHADPVRKIDFHSLKKRAKI